MNCQTVLPAHRVFGGSCPGRGADLRHVNKHKKPQTDVARRYQFARVLIISAGCDHAAVDCTKGLHQTDAESVRFLPSAPLPAGSGQPIARTQRDGVYGAPAPAYRVLGSLETQFPQNGRLNHLNVYRGSQVPSVRCAL